MDKRYLSRTAVSGIILASISTIAVIRYKSFYRLKKEINTIPYELEKPFNWRHFLTPEALLGGSIMGIFNTIAGWFKGSNYSVSDKEVTDVYGEPLQQEPIATAPVTEENTRIYTQEEITAVVNTVVEEAEKIAEVVVEEKEILSKEVIAIADAAAAEMLEKAKTSMPTTVSTTGNQPKATRKRKVSKKARKKK